MRRLLLVSAVLLGAVSTLGAMADASGLAGYQIVSWAGGDGVTLGSVRRIVQDRDGYLWLASSAGLVRFDGSRFATSNLVDGAELPAVPAWALYLSPDGSLWVGYANGRGVYRIQDGRVRDIHLQDQIGGFINAIVEDRAGTVWVGHDEGLHRLTDGVSEPVRFSPFGADPPVLDVHEDHAGTLWVATRVGAYRRPSGGGFERLADTDGTVRAISEDGTGGVWLAHTGQGFRPADGPARHGLSGVGMSLFHDRQDNLWVATIGQGLWKVHQPANAPAPLVDRATVQRGLLSDETSGFFEDRDGNIWAGSNIGLHRLTPHKAGSLTDIGLVQGIVFDEDGTAWVGTTDSLFAVSGSNGAAGERRLVAGTGVRSMHRADDGTIWVATSEGLHRLVRGQLLRLPIDRAGIALNRVTSLASDPRGVLWICDEVDGLVRMDGPRLSRPIEAASAPRPTLVRVDAAGRPWVVLGDGTVAVVDETGIVRRYTAGDGLPHRMVAAMHHDRAGNVWVGGDQGLSRLEGNRFRTLAAREGLPARAVVELIDDDTGALWVGMEAIGFLRIDPEEVARALHTAAARLDFVLYNVSVGTAGAPYSFLNNTAARDPAGRLWFVTARGLTVFDPARLRDDRGVAPGRPRIEAVTVDDRRYRAEPGVSIPPRANRLSIDYAVINLSSFDQTRFRYRLDGFDTGWVDGTGRRQASYTNMPPGHYTFRLQAAGIGGTWEYPEEVVWAFAIDPAFYQTTAFAIGAVLAFGALLAGAWRLRMRHVRRQLAAVLNERIRLSREIHDTLLQSLVGVALQLDAASADVRDSPLRARERLTRMRQQVEQYIREARQSIWDLRSSAAEERDIVRAIRDAGHRLTAGRVRFALNVAGTPRPCPSKVQAQVLRIAQEAVTNAVRHADAGQVDVELAFGERGLQLSVVDDGRGFDPQAAERNGHYGLIGMRERAAEVSGRCTIESSPGAGTRVVAEFPLAS